METLHTFSSTFCRALIPFPVEFKNKDYRLKRIQLKNKPPKQFKLIRNKLWSFKTSIKYREKISWWVKDAIWSDQKYESHI